MGYMSLYRVIAVSDNGAPGTCWAWMESAQRVCGQPEGDEAVHLCGAHVTVARRRAAKDAAANGPRLYEATYRNYHPQGYAQGWWAGITKRAGNLRVTDICDHRHDSREAAQECAERLAAERNRKGAA